MKAVFRVVKQGIGLASVLLIGALAVTRAGDAQQTSSSVEVFRVRPNFYMISGAGANIDLQVGPDGVLANSGTREASAAVLAEIIRKLSDRPIRYVLNTSADADSVGPNAAIAKAGHSIFSGVTGPRSEFFKAMTR